jgi:hypothetical protein
MGAAVAGAVATGGVGFLSSSGAAAATRSSSEDTFDGPVLDGSDVIAHVVDAKTGEISILVGTREIKYTNLDMAQQLVRVTQ